MVIGCRSCCWLAARPEPHHKDAVIAAFPHIHRSAHPTPPTHPHHEDDAVAACHAHARKTHDGAVAQQAQQARLFQEAQLCLRVYWGGVGWR